MNFVIRDGALCIQRGKDVPVSATGAWRIVFLEKDGYTVYRGVPSREEYTLTLKS